MTYVPLVNVFKQGDRIVVTVRQGYMARGVKRAYRWRMAGWFSLKELKEEERRSHD